MYLGNVYKVYIYAILHIHAILSIFRIKKLCMFVQLQQCLWQSMYKSMLCFRPRCNCCNVFVKVYNYWNEISIAGDWSSKHHVGQAGWESRDRKPHLRIKFWGNQVSGIMICPINSFNPPSSHYYGNRNVETNLTQNCQIAIVR